VFCTLQVHGEVVLTTGVLPTQCSAFLEKACCEADPSRRHVDTISTSCGRTIHSHTFFLAFFLLLDDNNSSRHVLGAYNRQPCGAPGGGHILVVAS